MMPACVRSGLRRSAAGLACAAVVAGGTSGCKPDVPAAPARVASSPTASASPAAPASPVARTSIKASSDPACTHAQKAVSTYGPAVVQDAIHDKESLDKAEIDLVVIVLNDAANSAGNSAVKQSITSLVRAYLELRGSLTSKIDSAIDRAIRADTRNLRSECRY